MKHIQVAQNRFQNLHLHKKLIKLYVLNGFLRHKLKILRLYITAQGTIVSEKSNP